MTKKTASKKPDQEVEARVLSRCQYGDINEVVRLNKDRVLSGVKAGLLDDHPSAIKAAKAASNKG